MSKPETIEYEWPDVGRLEISVYGNQSATLQLFPSQKVVEERVAKLSNLPTSDENSDTIKDTMNERSPFPTKE